MPSRTKKALRRSGTYTRKTAVCRRSRHSRRTSRSLIRQMVPGTPISERRQMAMIREMIGNELAATSTTTQSTVASLSRPVVASRRARKLNGEGQTRLHVAARRNRVSDVVTLLLEGADINATDYAGWTPLHEACVRASLDAARHLLAAGADVNALGDDDETPLHDAARTGDARVVSLLLRHGADTQLCNSALERPVDVANDYDIIQLLSRHTRDGHLSDDVTPVSVTSSEHDVMVNRAGCDEVEACSHHEPLDSATAGESDDDAVRDLDWKSVLAHVSSQEEEMSGSCVEAASENPRITHVHSLAIPASHVESSEEVVNMLMHLDGLHSNVSTASTAEQPNTQDCQPEACDIDDVSETASPDTQPDRVPRWPVRPVDSRPCVDVQRADSGALHGHVADAGSCGEPAANDAVMTRLNSDVLRRLSELADQHWNGPASLINNRQFNKHVVALMEDVRRRSAEHVRCSVQLSSLDDTALMTCHDDSTPHQTRAVQNELMEESRAVLDSIALLQSLGRAESSLAAADGQTPAVERLVDEKRQLAETLAMCGRHLPRMQQLAAMLHDSITSLMQINNCLLHELAEVGEVHRRIDVSCLDLGSCDS